MASKKNQRRSTSAFGKKQTVKAVINEEVVEDLKVEVVEEIKEEPKEEVVLHPEIPFEEETKVEPVVEEVPVVEEPVVEEPVTEEIDVEEAPVVRTRGSWSADELKFWQRTGIAPQ